MTKTWIAELPKGGVIERRNREFLRGKYEDGFTFWVLTDEPSPTPWTVQEALDCDIIRIPFPRERIVYWGFETEQQSLDFIVKYGGRSLG